MYCVPIQPRAKSLIVKDRERKDLINTTKWNKIKNTHWQSATYLYSIVKKAFIFKHILKSTRILRYDMNIF